ncbi:hypothetical protein ACHAW6_012896 [Cyclotella cf. meneghiniana]
MVLTIHSNTSYLNKTNTESRAGDITLCQRINVFGSGSRVRGPISKCKDSSTSSKTLKEMGQWQPPMPPQMDNSTAQGVVSMKIQLKEAKAIDMRLHWLQEFKAQDQF